jgi:hypothetical protein
MLAGSRPADSRWWDGAGPTLQPIRQRSTAESLHQVGALAQAPARR